MSGLLVLHCPPKSQLNIKVTTPREAAEQGADLVIINSSSTAGEVVVTPKDDELEDQTSREAPLVAWSSSWVASLDLGTAFEPTPRTLAESLSSPVSIPRTAAPASRSEPALNPLPPVSTQSRRCLPQLSQGRARAVRGGRPPLLRQIISTCYARCARVRGLGRCACSCERVRFGRRH